MTGNLINRGYLILTFLLLSVVCGQGQPIKKYDCDWLSDKAGQPFVKISVVKSGLQRIVLTDLPKGFTITDPSMVQIWHRGRQVSVVSATNSEIVFYGEVNDGERDKYLYRNKSLQPDTTARLNPYYSLFSDAGAYFLTLGASKGKRAVIVSREVDNSIPEEAYHWQSHVTPFSQEYSHSPDINVITLFLVQSFFEGNKGMTGRLCGKNLIASIPQVLGEWNTSVSLPDFYFGLTQQKPTVEFLVYGRNSTENVIRVDIGKDTNNLRSLEDGLKISGFGASKSSYGLDVTKDVARASGGNSAQVALRLRSGNITNSWATTSIFSVTYYKITYPQVITMGTGNTAIFNFQPTDSNISRLSIKNAKSDTQLYDISDSDEVKLLKGELREGTFNAMAPRTAGKAVKLLATNEVTKIESGQMAVVNLTIPDPEKSDFLIITSGALATAARQYADYRQSVQGGSYKSLVVEVEDIYNVFNYGEPSPLAIRSFVDYMLSKGIREKHNLLLLGYSTTRGDALKLNKDITGQVPTVGYPGSDLLLVTGLADKHFDTPAIPVGRVTAMKPEDVMNYLNKLKSYEANLAGTEGWKKQVLHVSGGKTGAEIRDLGDALKVLTPLVSSGDVGGEVTAIRKPVVTEGVEIANITPNVNAGVGMISYMGHGSPVITDFDMGYVSDETRGYANVNKYPLMYFNGCGVGNIFKGFYNRDLNAPDRVALSFDWILAKDRGAIAIVANSYYSFLSTTSKYLSKFYNELFVNDTFKDLSIGQVQLRTTNYLLGQRYDAYDIANIQQSVLQGDPAAVLIRMKKSDYSFTSGRPLYITSDLSGEKLESSKNISVSIVLENKGRYIANGKVGVRTKLTRRNGEVISKALTINSFPIRDTLTITIENNKDLEQIRVEIDDDNLIDEANEKNNVAVLDIEWGVAREQTVYPTSGIKDVVAPVLLVNVNGAVAKNKLKVAEKSRWTILLEDNVTLPADTSLIELYLKSCWGESCQFTKISLEKIGMTLAQLSTLGFKAEFDLRGYPVGDYQLLINAKDVSENRLSGPYLLNFSVVKELNDFNLVVSPNPATDYVRFELGGINIDEVSSLKLKFQVYSLDGKLVEQRDFDRIQPVWYWQPRAHNAGLFLYKVIVEGEAKVLRVVSGKVVVGK